MLITNGITTRNIAEKQLPEYVSKGYEVVTSAPPKPTEKAVKPPKKKGD